MAKTILCNQLSFEDVFDMHTGMLLNETEEHGSLGKLIVFPEIQMSDITDAKEIPQQSLNEPEKEAEQENPVTAQKIPIGEESAGASNKSNADGQTNTASIAGTKTKGTNVSEYKKEPAASKAGNQTFAQRKAKRAKKRTDCTKKKPQKVEMPESVCKLSFNGDFVTWLKNMGYGGVAFQCGYAAHSLETFYFQATALGENIMMTPVSSIPSRYLTIHLNSHLGCQSREDSIAFADENGNVWVSSVKIEKQLKTPIMNIYYTASDGTVSDYPPYSKESTEHCDSFILHKEDITVTGWKHLNKLMEEPQMVQDRETVKNIFQRTNPYAFAWWDKHVDTDLSLIMALACPYFETLSKAGYLFVRDLTKANVDEVNRLCQPGKNLKEIFKTSKAVYSTLKQECNMSVWDIYRKMANQGKISSDTIHVAYEHGYGVRDLTAMNAILNRKYKGQPLFTWTSLVNYLDRLDQFEAISSEESLPILRDYLIMCEQIEMKPKIDGDSLKREHDIAARIARQKRDERLAEGMDKVCGPLQKYNWENNGMFIRAVRSYDDLLEEARQQHNCVAGYAQRIIQGRSLIFFMRNQNSPNRSLITVELSPDRKQIRQKLMAYNKPIHDKEQTEFLDNWLAYLRTVK